MNDRPAGGRRTRGGGRLLPSQVGDVLLVDNLYTAHGPNPYTGSRDVQVALID
jgi:hypothetical protein